MRGLVALCVSRRGLVALASVLALLLGIEGARRVPLDVFPEFVPVQVEVQTEAPGMTPEQVEARVTRPIEAGLNGVQGLVALRSESIPGLSVAEGVVSLIDITRPSGASEQAMIQGWRADNFGYEDLKFTSGRRLAPGEKRKVTLGSTLAANLNKRVGDVVVFGRDDPDDPANRFEVVGVYTSSIIFEEGSALMSIEEARALTGMRVTGFSVRVARADGADHDAAVEAAKVKLEALRDPNDPTVRLAAQKPESYVTNLAHLRMLRAVAWLVSALGLVIGVIGMVNTMVMSVVERTQEIGILRAVGWPPRRVNARAHAGGFFDATMVSVEVPQGFLRR